MCWDLISDLFISSLGMDSQRLHSFLLFCVLLQRVESQRGII